MSSRKGYDIAKEIEKEWFLGVDRRFQAKSEAYHNLRKYARGEHDVAFSKSIITNKEDKTYTNYDFSPIQVLEKFKDKIVNDMLPQLYNVEANAVDRYSTDLKNKERDRLRRRMVSGKLDADMLEVFGIDMEAAHGDERPDSEEEIDLRMSMNFKPNVEIATEEALKYTFELNDYDEVLFELLNDAVDIGRIAVKESMHPSKGIIIERVDPAEMVWSHSRRRDHKDCWYKGLRERVTVDDLMTMTDSVWDMGKAVPEKIVLAGNTEFLKKLKGHIDTQFRITGAEESQDPNSMDKNSKVDLLYYTYKGVEETLWKKRTRKSGSTKITPFKGEYNGENHKGFEVISEKREVWYEGYLILGSNYTFGHKIVDNLAYDKKDGIHKVYPPIRMYATSLYQGKARGMIERCVSLIDKMQTTEIKIQQLVAATKPPGIRIDVSKINNIKSAGEVIDYKTVMKIYNETGVELYSSGDGEEGDFSQGNIHELRNGVVSGLMDLVNLQNSYLLQLREAIGIPQGADGSMPHPDTAVRVHEQVVRSSNVTLRHVLDSVLKLTRYCSDSVFVRIKDLLKYYPHLKKSYERAIGQINVDVVGELDNLSKHDLGIFISLKPSAQDRAQLESNIAIALERQTIDIDTAEEVRLVGESNTKLANQLLRVKREKREKKIAERENEKIKLQGEQQQNLAKVQAETEEMKKQNDLVINQSKIQSEAEAKIAIQNNETQNKMKILEFEYGLKERLERVKNEGMAMINYDTETQKTNRQRIDSQSRENIADKKSV